MSRLIILGNGFDLYHGLPTSYKDNLVPILRKNNEELFEKISKLYFKDDIELWSDFESRIGRTEDIDCLNNPIREKLEYLFSINVECYPIESPHYGNSWFEYENARYAAECNRVNLESVFSELHYDLDDLKEYFHDGLYKMCKYANELNNNKNNFQKDFDFREKDYFLTFNYTNTLEKIYTDIPNANICYIHGLLNDEVELVFGNNKKNILNSYSDLYEENPNVSRGKEGDYDSYTHQEYVEAVTYKPCEFEKYNNDVDKYMNQLNESMIKEIQLEKLENFLSKLKIKEIFVFGLSMGEVDHPYFELINQKFLEAEWFISYYKSSDIVEENTQKLKFNDKIVLLEMQKFIKSL